MWLKAPNVAEGADYTGASHDVRGLFVLYPLYAMLHVSRDVGHPPASKAAPADQFGPPRLRHCPILIVEDDADLREMMTQLLSLEGFEAHAVANGREALDYLRQAGERPDVILLDLMMPVMDGWEFRRQQRSDPDFADVPVIVLSALDPARGADIGAIEFLKKPLDFDRLLELIRQYCV
jgi:CheY-like chemotaxis protein